MADDDPTPEDDWDGEGSLTADPQVAWGVWRASKDAVPDDPTLSESRVSPLILVLLLGLPVALLVTVAIISR